MGNHTMKHKGTKPLRGHKDHKEDILINPFVVFVLLCELCV